QEHRTVRHRAKRRRAHGGGGRRRGHRGHRRDDPARRRARQRRDRGRQGVQADPGPALRPARRRPADRSDARGGPRPGARARGGPDDRARSRRAGGARRRGRHCGRRRRSGGGGGVSRRLRAAVVGVGYLGRFHAEKYAAHPGAELVAVVDVDAERARQVARALGAEATTDYRALIGRIDCASVVVPTPLHGTVAHELLAAGIDVLVEKPLTTTIEEGKSLLEAAVRGGRVLQVGHLERFNPALRALNGLLTQPRFIECVRLAPFTERGTDVDVVLDLMIHDLDVILSMVPSAVRAVEAVGVPVLTGSVDIANARLRFFQPDAYFSVDYGEHRVRIFRREPRADGQPCLVAEERQVAEGDALAAEIDAFVQAVRRRETPPVTGWDGLRALEVAHVIRESVETEVRTAQATGLA